MIKQVNNHPKKPLIKINISELGHNIPKLKKDELMGKFRDKVSNPNDFIKIINVNRNTEKDEQTEFENLQHPQKTFFDFLSDELNGNLKIANKDSLIGGLQNLLDPSNFHDKIIEEKKELKDALSNYGDEILNRVTYNANQNEEEDLIEKLVNRNEFSFDLFSKSKLEQNEEQKKIVQVSPKTKKKNLK